MKKTMPKMAMDMKVPNKNPGSSAKVTSSKTANMNGHLSAHQGKISAVASKNKVG